MSLQLWIFRHFLGVKSRKREHLALIFTFLQPKVDVKVHVQSYASEINGRTRRHTIQRRSLII